MRWIPPRVALIVGVMPLLVLDGPQSPAYFETLDERSKFERYVGFPILFEPNAGQVESSSPYVARSRGLLAELDAQGFVLTSESSHRGSVAVRFVSSNSAALGRPVDPASTVFHYYKGSDPTDWHEFVPTYHGVRFSSIYEGVDVAFHGRNGRLEYDFEVTPGADPRQIGLQVDGHDRIELSGSGDIVIQSGADRLVIRRPAAFQEVAGRREMIESRFIVDENIVSFELGEYSPERVLIIDPEVIFASVFGTTELDRVHDVVVGDDGSSYFCGEYGTGGLLGNVDAWVAKATPAGDELEWAAFFGGADTNDNAFSPPTIWGDVCYGLTLDGLGNVFATGLAGASNFPILNAQDPVKNGPSDAFLVGFRLDGTGFYSSFFGGSGRETARDIYSSSAALLYVAGWTTSSDLSAGGSYQDGFGGDRDAFVAAFDLESLAPTAVTYIGGVGDEEATAITGAEFCFAVCETAAVLVAGEHEGSTAGFPFENAAHTSSAGFQDGFAVSLDPDLATSQFATLFGGSGSEFVTSIAAFSDESGPIIAGRTNSDDLNFPLGFQPEPGGRNDGFLVRFDPSGVETGGTYVGGAGYDAINGIAVDPLNGLVYLVGQTDSPEYFSVNATQPTLNEGTLDGFLAVLRGSPEQILFATYIGGSGSDDARAVALSPTLEPIVAGDTGSDDFPVTTSATGQGEGHFDVFIAHIRPDLDLEAPVIQTSVSELSFGGPDFDEVTIFNVGGGALEITDIAVDEDPPFSVGDLPLPVSLEPGDEFTFDVTYDPTDAPDVTSGTLTISSNDPVTPSTEVSLRVLEAPEILVDPDPLIILPAPLAETPSVVVTVTNTSDQVYGIELTPPTFPFRIPDRPLEIVTELTPGASLAFTIEYDDPLLEGPNLGRLAIYQHLMGAEILIEREIEAIIVKASNAGGIAIDYDNPEPDQFPRQSVFTQLQIEGVGLEYFDQITLNDPSGIAISEIEHDGGTMAFRLVADHATALGERDLLLVNTEDEASVSMSEVLGRRFIVTSAATQFNQAVDARALPDPYTDLLVADKQGAIRIQFEDPARVGEVFEGGCYRIDEGGVNLEVAATAYGVQGEYTAQERLAGLDYLVVPMAVPSKNSESVFVCSLVRQTDGATIWGPRIRRSFADSRTVRILALPLEIESTTGEILRPNAAVDEHLADLLKGIYPVGERNLRFVSLPPTRLRPPVEVVDAKLLDGSDTKILPLDAYIAMHALLRSGLESLNALPVMRRAPFHGIVALVGDGLLSLDTDEDGVVDFERYGYAFKGGPWFLMGSSSNVEGTLAHEFAHRLAGEVKSHLNETDAARFAGRNFGDEYEGGNFRCLVNPPVREVVDKTGEEGCPDSPFQNGRDGDLVGTFTGSTAFNPRNGLPTLTDLSLSPPSVSYNFMSNAEDVWVSDHVYALLYDILMPLPGTGKSELAAQTPVAGVGGFISRDGTGTLEEVILTEIGVADESGDGVYSIELRSEAGAPLLTHRFDVEFFDDSEPPVETDRVDFHFRLEWPTGVAGIALLRDGEELASRDVSTNAPTVDQVIAFQALDGSGAVELSWSASDADDDALTYGVFYRPNEEIVLPVATGLEETTARFLPGQYRGATDPRIIVSASDGVNTGQLEVDLGFEVVRSEPAETVASTEFALGQNFPNPFAGRTTIEYAIPENALVRLTVHDLLGRQIRVLVDGPQSAGMHQVRYEPRDLPTGTYLYRLNAGRWSTTRMMIVLR